MTEISHYVQFFDEIFSPS